MSRLNWTILVLFIILGFGALTFYINQKANDPELYERQEEIGDIIERPKETINVRHQFKDGVHTYVGDIELPSPCYKPLNVQVNENPEEKIIAFEYKLDEDAICTQQVIEESFRVSFEGEEYVNVLATINGELVNLNIFEINPEENIDDAEIFIKG